jgi:hypothetical protein
MQKRKKHKFASSVLNVLRWIFRKLDWGGMDWIDLAKDRDRLQASINTVMNLHFP